MIKAILFDLDGVLVDMPDAHYEALNRALGLFGAHISYDEHTVLFNGLPTRKKVEMLEATQRLPIGLREFINQAKQQYTIEEIPKHCHPDYSKIILLKFLKDKGFKLACCSNSVRSTINLMLQSAQLTNYFDVILGNDEIKNPKPAPDIYLRAFDLLSVKPDECVIIEDAHHGVAAARASGAKVIKVDGVDDVNLSLFKEYWA